MHFPDVGGLIWNNLRKPPTIEGPLPPRGANVRVLRLEVFGKWADAPAYYDAEYEAKELPAHDPPIVRRTLRLSCGARTPPPSHHRRPARRQLKPVVEAVEKPFWRGCQNSRVVIERRRRNWTKTSARSRKTRCMTREALTVGCYDESSDNASCFCGKKNRFLRVFLQAR